MRQVIFPVALLWTAWTLFRLRRAWREWNHSLSRAVLGDPAVPHFGFFHFLTVDPVVEARKLVAETADKRREEISRRQEKLRREQFETEIRVRRERFEAEVRDRLKALERLGQESPCDEEWLTGASTVELEEMAARCRHLVERHQDQVEKEQQAARERARQIQWLESEFSAIPPEKPAEAARAWALYEQACATSDPGKRLDALKSARKLLPKEFQSDRLH